MTSCRAAGDRKIHFAEAAFWGMNFQDLQVMWDDNMAYAWHFYPTPQDIGWLTGSLTGPSFEPILDQDVPMWLSETGSDGNLATFMLTANSGNPMAYTPWLHKRSGGGGGEPWGCPRPASYNALLDNWEGTSSADADTALFEWAESLRTENCNVYTDVVSRLGGNP